MKHFAIQVPIMGHMTILIRAVSKSKALAEAKRMNEEGELESSAITPDNDLDVEFHVDEIPPDKWVIEEYPE